VRTDYPGSESSQFPITFAPGSVSSRELSLPGTKVLSGNFRSEKQKLPRSKVLIPKNLSALKFIFTSKFCNGVNDQILKNKIDTKVSEPRH